MKSKYKAESKLGCTPVNKKEIIFSVVTRHKQLFTISTSRVSEKYLNNIQKQ